MRDLRAACVQTAASGGPVADHLAATLEEAGGKVDLVVLPELCTVPYFPLEADSADVELAIGLDDPSLERFGQIARSHGCHLMIGVLLTEDQQLFNAAVLFGPDGNLLEARAGSGGGATSYRKVHLCDVDLPGARFRESEYFGAGDEYLVWETSLGTVGVLICYDRHFPEAWISLRELGAEIVCVCTTSALNTAPSFVAEIQAMSLQQAVYALTANRVGTEQLRSSGIRTEFLGSSCITGPAGEVLAVAEPRVNDPFVVADLSAQRLSELRTAHRFHEHRRPQTYLQQTDRRTTAR